MKPLVSTVAGINYSGGPGDELGDVLFKKVVNPLRRHNDRLYNQLDIFRFVVDSDFPILFTIIWNIHEHEWRD